MAKLSDYLNFIKANGKHLSESYSGSDEIALEIIDAQQALKALNDSKIPVLGGDILSIDDLGKLIYAHQLWGEEYHYLNWYCEKENGESNIDYCLRSIETAMNAIKNAEKISKELNKKCYIVLVI